jgi:hypothetical protein
MGPAREASREAAQPPVAGVAALGGAAEAVGILPGPASWPGHLDRSMTPPPVAARLSVAGRALLVALGAVLPFELTRPLGRLGPLEISSVELFLYAAVGVWAAGVAAAVLRGERPWRSLPAAYVGVAAWALALMLSAALAPAERGAALKFTLRSLGGVMVYLAAADLLRAPGAVLHAGLGIAGGAVVASALATAEVYLPGVAAVLAPFHDRTFDVLGLVRASGPFQFPNIAAMYLAAAAPVTIAATASLAGAGARPWARVSTVVLAIVVLLAIALTGSRAGLATVTVVIGGLVVVARGFGRLRRSALAALLGLGVIVAAVQVSGSPLALRLRFWQDGSWYRSSITVVGGAGVPAGMQVGVPVSLTLELRNEGAIPWPAGGPRPVQLAYHWLDPATPERAVASGPLTALPHDVPPGRTAAVRVELRTPPRPGSYTLRWDLVHHDVAWFSERGDPVRSDPVQVTPPPPGSTGARPGGALAPLEPVAAAASLPGPLPAELSRRTLWRTAIAIFLDHPLLGTGPDNFRNVYGRYIGKPAADRRFHANSLYLETLADMGLAGALALVALIVALAVAARRAIARSAADTAARTLSLAVNASLAAFLLHGTLDHFFEFTPTYALFWLLAGMLVALTQMAPHQAAAEPT